MSEATEVLGFTPEESAGIDRKGRLGGDWDGDLSRSITGAASPSGGPL